MTAYNRENYIAEAIESVLASTYRNFELIIADDGSKDRTVEIANAYAAVDKRVRLHINEKNLGDYGNRNFIATLASGVYLKYLDSDDCFYPHSLQYCVALMEANKSAEWGIFNTDAHNEALVFRPAVSIQTHFFRKPFLLMGPGGTIYKTSFFFAAGTFPERYGPANDMYFNLVCASKGNVVLMTKDFLFYRRHEGQEINNVFSYLYNNYRFLADVLPVISHFLTTQQINWIEKKSKRRFVTNIVRFFFASFNILKTKEAISRAKFTLSDAVQGLFHNLKSPGEAKI